jgi:DNA-directed RNA polymerase subunit L
MNLNFVVTNTEDPYLLKFTLENTSASFANSIRRTIISDVDTAGFDTEDYSTSSVRIIENTSALHNEFLLHRIGMIPINITDTSSFDTSKYKFTINVENTTNIIMDVTTADFEVVNTETGKREETLDFFPPNRITGENILIVKLKPNPGGKGEKIHLEGNAFIGNGAMNARFSPTSAVMYVNQIDPTKVETAMTKYISEAQESAGDEPVDTEQLKRRFMIAESERHFMTDENDEPNVFDFTIESVEVMPSTKILDLACAKLVEKLGMVKTEIVKAINGEESAIQIADALTVMEARDITFPEETHTLGYLLQDALLRIVPKTDLLFVGYQNPHPLEKKIVVRVSLTNNTPDSLRDKLTFVIDTLVAEYNKIRSALKSQFGEL